ncbi:phosphatase PAP2 family protein [Peterkaempfera sp. SMS 1(5)a]|uniref:phosphatase PAP2 family protein n=1 Tax=Peterkaempfera podocarpi TaxID=3232308 RepID=UPI00367248A0
MENEQPPVIPPAGEGRATTEDNPSDASPQPQSRSTDRPAHTPRDERNGDHPSRPGALPPAPGRLHHALATPWVPAALLTLLLAISWQVSDHGPLLHLDTAVRSALARAHAALPAGTLRPAADRVGELFSDLGNTVVAIPVLLFCAALATWLTRRAGHPRWWLPMTAAAGAALLLPALVVPAKAWFGRPGPDGSPLLPGQWGWYPSGHTATATVAYGTAAVLLSRAAVRLRRRTALCVSTALVVTGVGLGLLWRHYHWFLDVLAGWCLAGVVLWALARVLPAVDGRD